MCKIIGYTNAILSNHAANPARLFMPNDYITKPIIDFQKLEFCRFFILTTPSRGIAMMPRLGVAIWLGHMDNA
jgi:hypothetical protein